MRRADRQQSRDFALELIDRCTHGVMAMSGPDATPYCVPLSLVRVGNDLYFHCAAMGEKLELLHSNPKVCVSFVGGDEPVFIPPAMYSTYYQSAIVTGTAAEVTQENEKISALRALCEKLTPLHMDGFDRAVEQSLSVTAVWRIQMEEVTGKAKVKK